MNDLEEREEEILPRKQSEKRGRNPQLLNGSGKENLRKDFALIDPVVQNGGRKFVPSALQDSVDVK